MTPMMKRKKSDLGPWQPIKPTAPCKPYSDPNNKIRLYKTLIKPILCYGSVTQTLTQAAEHLLVRLKGKYYEEYTAQHKKGDAGVPDGKTLQSIQRAKHRGGD
jgi:hypothetical protein